MVSHYGDAPFLQEQRTLLDLIPRRKIVLASWAAAGMVVMVGLGFAHTWMLGRVADGVANVAALDLGVKGSLGCWFSSVLLLAASLGAFLVYLIRRHRIDDYQGRYRIWCWASACWLLIATDQSASLREAFRDLMVNVTGTRLVGDGSLWWVVAYAMILGAVGSRLLIDMRSSWFSLTVLVVAAMAHILAAAFRLDWLVVLSGNQQTLLFAECQMAGNLLVLLAMMLFARHVLFDAEGLLPIPEEKQAENLVEEEDEAEVAVDSEWRKIDSPHGTPQPVFQRVQQTQPTVAVAKPAVSASFTPAPLSRKLTKGEKRALKEKLLRDRAERERKCG
jgi:hypothetical protein